MGRPANPGRVLLLCDHVQRSQSRLQRSGNNQGMSVSPTRSVRAGCRHAAWDQLARCLVRSTMEGSAFLDVRCQHAYAQILAEDLPARQYGRGMILWKLSCRRCGRGWEISRRNSDPHGTRQMSGEGGVTQVTDRLLSPAKLISPSVPRYLHSSCATLSRKRKSNEAARG